MSRKTNFHPIKSLNLQNYFMTLWQFCCLANPFIADEEVVVVEVTPRWYEAG